MSFPNVLFLVLFQTNNLISSEDDAAMALQVSKALTSALLKYRLNSTPDVTVSLFSGFKTKV